MKLKLMQTIAMDERELVMYNNIFPKLQVKCIFLLLFHVFVWHCICAYKTTSLQNYRLSDFVYVHQKMSNTSQDETFLKSTSCLNWKQNLKVFLSQISMRMIIFTFWKFPIGFSLGVPQWEAVRRRGSRPTHPNHLLLQVNIIPPMLHCIIYYWRSNTFLPLKASNLKKKNMYFACQHFSLWQRPWLPLDIITTFKAS